MSLIVEVKETMSLVEQETELSRELWDAESQNSSMTLAKATSKGLSSPVWVWLKDQIFPASEFPLHNLEPLFGSCFLCLVFRILLASANLPFLLIIFFFFLLSSQH